MTHRPSSPYTAWKGTIVLGRMWNQRRFYSKHRCQFTIFHTFATLDVPGVRVKFKIRISHDYYTWEAMSCVVDTNILQRKYKGPNSYWVITFSTPALCSEICTHYMKYPIHYTACMYQTYFNLVGIKKKRIYKQIICMKMEFLLINIITIVNY